MPDEVEHPCPKCGAPVARIQRYRVTVEWERDPGTGAWSLGTFDNGTHFHLFCQRGCEVKRWGRDLPALLQSVVFPGNLTDEARI